MNNTILKFLYPLSAGDALLHRVSKRYCCAGYDSIWLLLVGELCTLTVVPLDDHYILFLTVLAVWSLLFDSQFDTRFFRNLQ